MTLTLRKAWSRVHGFIGISAGTVLMVVGLSGAVLSFREELLALLNPGTVSVPVQPTSPLAPAQLAAAVRAERGDARIATITLYAQPGRSARITFAPAPGERRGEIRLADPYSGVLLPLLRGADFFDWVESLHRWLLLPRDDGKPVAGTLAACLLVLAASGLYLRWPRRALNWRAWLTFNTKLSGRPFLWGLHSVLGTCALLMYLVLSLTGVYWAFDAVRDRVDALAGSARPARASRPSAGRTDPAKAERTPNGTPADLSLAWSVFRRQAGAYDSVTLRLPERASQAVQFIWLDAAAPHERARNRLSVQPQTGELVQEERFAELPAGSRFLAAIYPLHMGSYFGLPGRVTMMLASLSLPLFGVTGWMLYLGRRRAKRAMQVERARLAAAPVVVSSSGPASSASRKPRRAALRGHPRG